MEICNLSILNLQFTQRIQTREQRDERAISVCLAISEPQKNVSKAAQFSGPKQEQNPNHE